MCHRDLRVDRSGLSGHSMTLTSAGSRSSSGLNGLRVEAVGLGEKRDGEGENRGQALCRFNHRHDKNRTSWNLEEEYNWSLQSGQGA